MENTLTFAFSLCCFAEYMLKYAIHLLGNAPSVNVCVCVCVCVCLRACL